MSLIKSKIDDHTEIQIEVEERHTGYEQTGAAAQKAAALAEDAFQRAIETLAQIGRKFATARNKFGDDVPQEFEVSFGVKITAEGDVWLAKVAGEAQITAKAIWKK